MRRLTFPVVLVLLLTTAAYAYAGGKSNRNTLQEIAVTEDPAATLIRISGSDTPTFNVFRLDDPPRLFIDIAGGDIQAVDGTVEVFNGVIARIGTLSYNKGGAEFARVIVTFETDAPYDVSARGNDILVVVDADQRKLQDARPEALAKLEEAVLRERTLLADLKNARTREEQLVAVARQKRAEEESLQARIAQEAQKAEEMRRAAEQARLKALAESELLAHSRAKVAEERAAADDLVALEESRIAALREERERLEAAREAAREAAEAQERKQAAMERAVALAQQARQATEEERQRAEELKAAALDAAVKEKEKVALLRLQTKLQQERKDALEKELADVVAAKEAALAEAVELGRQKQREIEAAAQAKVAALNAKLAATRVAVKKEEERQQALKEANRQEELRLAAMKDAAAKDIERRNAEIERQLKDEALAEARQTAARLEEERKHLDQLVAKRQAAQSALATVEKDRALLEQQTQKLESRWQEQASVVEELKKVREAKFKELAIAEAELVNQKNAVGQLRAQFELEKESLERMVEARKAEEVKLAALKAEAARVKQGKTAQDNARLAKLNEDLDAKQARLDGVTRKLNELEREYQRTTTQAQANESRVKDLQKELAARKQDVAWLKGKYENLKGSLEQTRTELQEKEAAVMALKDEMVRKETSFKQASAEYASTVSATEEKARLTAEERKQLQELKAKLAKAQEDRSRLERDRAELQERLGNMTTEVAKKEEANKLLSDKLGAAAATVQQLSQREADARKALVLANQQRDNVEQELTNLTGSLARKSSELDRLTKAFEEASAGKSASELAADAQFAQMRAEIAAATASLEQLQSRKGTLEERLVTVQSEAAELKGTVATLQQRVLREEQERMRIAADKTAMEGKLQATASALKARQQELTELAARIEDSRSAALQWKGKHEAALLEAQKEKSQREALALKLKALNDELNRRNQDLGKYKGLYEEKVAETSVVKARKGGLEERLAQKEKALREAKEMAAEARAENAVWQDRYAHLEGELKATQARLQVAEENKASMANAKAELAASVARLQADLRTAQAIAADDSQLAATQKELKAAQERQAKLTQELAAAQKKATRVTELESEIAQVKDAARRAAEYKEELSRTQRELESARKAAVSRNANTRDIQRASELAKTVQALEAKLAQAKTSKAQMATLHKQLRAAEKEAARVGSLEQKIARLEQYREKADSLEAQVQEAESARSEVKRLKAALAQEKLAAQKRASELADELASSKTQRQQLADKMQAELARAEADKARLESELRASRTQQVDKQLHERLLANLESKDQELAAMRAEISKSQRTAAAAPVPTPVAAPPKKIRARLTSVDFDVRNGTSAIELKMAGEPQFQVIEKSPTELLLVLQDTALLPVLERTLDTSEFDGVVRSISSYRSPTSPETTIVSVQLSRPVTGKTVASAKGISWTFAGGDAAANKAIADAAPTATVPRKSRAVAMYPEGVSAGGAQAGGAAGAAPMGSGGSGGGLSVAPAAGSPFGIINPRPGKKKKKYTGRRINLSIKDADIQHVLAYLARVGGVNIVTNEGVSGKVSFYLEDVPWDLALDMILRASGLDYIKEQGIYRVAPVEDIQKEYEMALEKKKKLTELKQLQVKLIPVNYADAKDLIKQIKPISSAKGSVSMDQRTNTLIVKDIEEHVQAIEDLVKRLDAQTPQVLIEARIVEASKDYGKDLGVQWGGSGQASSATANPTGLIFPSSVGIAGGASDQAAVALGLFAPANPNYAVNLPAPAGQGSGGAIGLTLGSLGGAANLSLRLSAAEEEGTVKIVSAPKISTIDNHKATIQQGISFPVSVVSAQGVNTQFFDAQLKMDVTPHVTQDGNIMLKVDITKNEPDFSQTGANGNPTIRKKEAHTSLLLKDGDTTVIGGIYTRNTASSKKKVPFFADLPLIGSLFSNWSETDSRSELLIFVTPRIVNRQASRVRTEFE